MSFDFATRTLADVIESANTGLDAIKRAPIVERDTGFKCLRIQDISQEKNISKWGFTEVSENNFSKFQLNQFEILIARTGGSVGVSRFINEKVNAVFNNGLIRLRVNRKEHDAKYVFYLLQTESYRTHIHAIAHSTAAQPNMKIRDFLSFRFVAMKKHQEIEIAKVLSALDDRIALLRETNATLEAIAQALFKSWFVDFDPVRAKMEGRAPEGMDEDTARLFPDGLEESELGLVPRGWAISTVGESFVLTMGQSPPGDTYSDKGIGMPFYQGRTDFGFRFPTQRMYCLAPTRIAEFGDTLVSVRAPVGDVNMAIERCCVGRGVASVRHPKDYRSFTFYAMRGLSQHFENFDSEGTIFGSINKRDFQALPVIAPTLPALAAYEAVSSPIDAKIVENEKQMRSLATLRDTLLPRLISGQLRLPDAEAVLENA